MNKKIYTRIIGTGGYLPENLLTNSDLEKMVDTTDEWIFSRTGVKTRHIMSKDESTTSMAEIAANRAIEASGINKNEIELIIVATSTPHKFFPNTACCLQNALGITSTLCPSFDVSVACSGFIYALSIADQYITSGKVKCALIVGAESLTKFVDWTDRTTCVLFSDGAGAVVVKADSEPGIYSTHLHSDGSFGEFLYNSGSNYHNDEPRHIKMAGNKLFKVAVNRLDEIVEEVLKFNNIEQSKIDWLIPHQANLRIIEATAKKLGLSMNKVILTIEDQGNTSAASVPLALDIGVRDGRVKKGDLLLLEVFGAGLGWGASLIRY
jgi:3-oxoacyl-[acyl-carrier-protein] synthase-3